MDYDTATDLARIGCSLIIILIFVFMRKEAQVAGLWSRKGLQLFLFNIFLLVTIFFGFVEKIAADAPPAISPFVTFVVFSFGAYAMGSKGGLTKPEQRDE